MYYEVPTATNDAVCRECMAILEVPKEIGTTAVDLHTYVIEQNVRCIDCSAQHFAMVDFK